MLRRIIHEKENYNEYNCKMFLSLFVALILVVSVINCPNDSVEYIPSYN